MSLLEKRVKKISFEQFVGFFPEVDLPVTLTVESHFTFSERNIPLSQAGIVKFIMPNEPEMDEFTEVVPCLRLPETHGFFALLYWKASLMTYEYILATYDEKGNFIAKRTIAGTNLEGEMLEHVVSTIDEDWIILQVKGKSNAQEDIPSNQETSTNNLELLATGEIIDL